MDKRINVTRSSMPSLEEYCEEIKELWDSRWLTNNGAKHKQLEAGLKEYLDCDNIVLYTNGHLALEQAIEAMNFPKGAEVITTPFTFFATSKHSFSFLYREHRFVFFAYYAKGEIPKGLRSELFLPEI